MASVETNLKFFKKILSEETLTTDQRNQLIDLFGQYLENITSEKDDAYTVQSLLTSSELNKGLSFVQKLIESRTQINTSTDSRVKAPISHNPGETAELLKSFTRVGYLKWATHEWDIDSTNEKSTVDRNNFSDILRSDFSRVGLGNLQKFGLTELYWDIYHFLFTDYEKDKLLIEWNKRWGKALVEKDNISNKGLIYGWGCSSLREYYLSNSSASPWEFVIPKSHLPAKYKEEFTANYWELFKMKKVDQTVQILAPTENDIEVYKSLKNGIAPKFFKDMIDAFKGLIEFRGNRFYFLFYMIFKKYNQMDWTVNLAESFESVKGENIYTYTSGLENALKIIRGNIRLESKEIQIESNVNREEGTLTVDITDLGSFSRASVLNDKLQLNGSGQMRDIRDSLVSICDFSILSLFKNEDDVIEPIELVYLSKTNNHISDDSGPEVIKSEEQIRGFTYRLTFYL